MTVVSDAPAEACHHMSVGCAIPVPYGRIYSEELRGEVEAALQAALGKEYVVTCMLVHGLLGFTTFPPMDTRELRAVAIPVLAPFRKATS